MKTAITEPVLLHRMKPLEILFISLRVFLQTLHILIGFAAVFLLPIVFLTIILTIFLIVPLVLGLESVETSVDEDSCLFIFGVLGVISIPVFVLYSLLIVPASLMVSFRLQGQHAGFFQILKKLRGKRSIRLMGTTFLQVLIIYAGLFFCYIPGIYLGVRLLFVTPVAVLENVSYKKALKRSWELSQGHGWWIAGNILLILVLAISLGYGISTVITYPFVPTGTILHQVAGDMGDYAFMLISPVLFVYFPVTMYYNVRMRKEAYDIKTLYDDI